MSHGNGRRALRVRRSPHLVAYWRNHMLVACNYATGTNARITTKACEILDFCNDWTAIEDLQAAHLMTDAALRPTIDRLVELSLLERSDRPIDPRVVAMDHLRPWNPAVGFFHATTRDVRFTSPRQALRYAKIKAKHAPAPPAIKRYP